MNLADVNMFLNSAVSQNAAIKSITLVIEAPNPTEINGAMLAAGGASFAEGRGMEASYKDGELTVTVIDANPQAPAA